MSDDKVRENLLRRRATRQGFKLMKSRRRDPNAIDYGGFMLVDGFINSVVCGADSFDYSADLDEIEQHLDLLAGRKTADQETGNG